MKRNAILYQPEVVLEMQPQGVFLRMQINQTVTEKTKISNHQRKIEIRMRQCVCVRLRFEYESSLIVALVQGVRP